MESGHGFLPLFGVLVVSLHACACPQANPRLALALSACSCASARLPCGQNLCTNYHWLQRLVRLPRCPLSCSLILNSSVCSPCCPCCMSPPPLCACACQYTTTFVVHDVFSVILCPYRPSHVHLMSILGLCYLSRTVHHCGPLPRTPGCCLLLYTQCVVQHSHLPACEFTHPRNSIFGFFLWVLSCRVPVRVCFRVVDLCVCMCMCMCVCV